MNFVPAPHTVQHWHLRKPAATGRRGMVVSQCKNASEAGVAVLDAGARDHLRTDEARPEAPSLAAERLHADARHRRQDEPGRDLDRPDRPGLSEVDHRRQGW